jgi:protease-4
MIAESVRRAAKVKKVVAWFGSISASGGYYVASAADEIIATPLSATGGIGVVLVLFNYRGLLDKVGVEPMIFTSGAYKDLYSGLRDSALSEEERAIIQDRLEEAYDHFLAVVSEGRAIPVETLRTDIADGRIFSGEQARELQLVDRIGYFEDAVARARELAGAPNARVIRYRRPFSIRDILTARSDPPALRLDVGQTGIRVAPGRMYFLPRAMVIPAAD